ncbi:MAG TPA: YbgC/FadM family acyl-CoA thioesterase [Thermodesulfobacteriota bacterium]|nr:YbgC/FadM family acyl-CoA thioesterase [Thermodesulfobacteriota bacterium]
MAMLEVKIYYEDTDCGGVVYHANYLRYCERARTEYFAEQGISIRDYMKNGIVFVVVRAEIFYESPARYGDVLIINSELEKVRRVSLDFKHTIRRKDEDGVLVRATIRLACLNGDGKLTPLPKGFLEVLGA